MIHLNKLCCSSFNTKLCDLIQICCHSALIPAGGRRVCWINTEAYLYRRWGVETIWIREVNFGILAVIYQEPHE